MNHRHLSFFFRLILILISLENKNKLFRLLPPVNECLSHGSGCSSLRGISDLEYALNYI